MAITVASIAGVASAQPSTSAGSARPAVVNTGKIYFGVDGTDTPAGAGTNVARHLYGQLSSSVPNGRMVTMGITGYTYTSVASAAPGSAIYANIVRWADTIKARGTLTFFGFVHEPGTPSQSHFGSASKYIAAYQHVVDIFRAQNVANARYVWQMTAFAFVTTGPGAAANYYPGNAYVDIVAEDPYNWDGCGPGGPWRDLSTAATPALKFAEAHGKLTMLGEFASQAGPQRASWLASAQKWLIANRGQIQAAFYFDLPTTPSSRGCNWFLSSHPDVAAFRAIVDDTPYFAS